ncbi:MAG: hypothetical protein GXY33_14690 [Phycisphaerae bacterium]|nr:hypothetical protein [Phycisphaerae bacterium]
MKRVRPILILAGAVWMLLSGCQAGRSREASPAQRIENINREHVRIFGDFHLPRTIGAVPNTGLQLPTVSPDGEWLLHLRSDGGDLDPRTLLGDPNATPAEGTLTVMLRPTAGGEPGRPISKGYRWAHSPVWSPTGRSMAFVANEPPGSSIIHLDLATGRQTVLGVPHALNCLPRFAASDDQIVYCSAVDFDHPFRIYRQRIEGEPQPMAPKGDELLLPVSVNANEAVVCARNAADSLEWVLARPSGLTLLAGDCGLGNRAAALQTLAGVADPISPNGDRLLFYDTRQNRICLLDLRDNRLQRHRQGAIAACWLTDDVFALATSDYLFSANVETGLSPQILDGPWIPLRYVPARRTLLILGPQGPNRFAIVEVRFVERNANTDRPNTEPAPR